MNEVALAKIILLILTELGTWELGALLVFVLVLPPLLHALVLWKIAKAHLSVRDAVVTQMSEDNERFEKIVSSMEKQFQAFETKYDNNILLVTNYEKLAGDLATIIHLNTQAMTRLIELIKGMKGAR